MKIFISGGVSVLQSGVRFTQNRELLRQTMKALGRDLLSCPVRSREELEGQIIKLLEQRGDITNV
jgi:hypothetical protein